MPPFHVEQLLPEHGDEVVFFVHTPHGDTVLTTIRGDATVSYDGFLETLFASARAGTTTTSMDIAPPVQQHQHEQQQQQEAGRKRSRDELDDHDGQNNNFCRQVRPRFATVARSNRVQAASPAATASQMAYIVHQGRIVHRDEFQQWFASQQQQQGPPHQQQYLELKLRIRGGMVDRQNRVGTRFGGGGVSSAQNAERERKERLKQLALESIDLAKDPYLMRNHLGTYECKLCLTLHTNEGNYLAHTQGKKHQSGLARRAALEAKLLQQQQQQDQPLSGMKPAARPKQEHQVRIGRPGYQVSKSRDASKDNERWLSFELHFPELPAGNQPRHRFMSAFEQRVETPPDRRYQYLLVAGEPYETVAFKIPNEPIDREEGRFMTNWNAEEKKFTITFFYLNPTDTTTTTEETKG